MEGEGGKDGGGEGEEGFGCAVEGPIRGRRRGGVVGWEGGRGGGERGGGEEGGGEGCGGFDGGGGGGGGVATSERMGCPMPERNASLREGSEMVEGSKCSYIISSTLNARSGGREAKKSRLSACLMVGRY